MIPVESDYWVRYSEAQTNAGTLAVYAMLLAVALSIYLPTVTHAYVFVIAFINGMVVLVWLIDTARNEWRRAKMARIGYRSEQEAAAAFVSIFATTVLKTLQAAVEGAEKTNEGGST